MCPQRSEILDHGFMAEDLFRKIVDEVILHKGVFLVLGGRGESMVHPRWEEYVAYAKRAGVAPMWILTNGTLLDHERASLLVDLGVEEIAVTIDGATKETYEAMRVGARYDRVLENMHRLIELRRSRGNGRPRILMRMIQTAQNEHEVGAFRTYWQEHLEDHDGIKITGLISWVPMDEAESILSQAEATGYQAIRHQPTLMAPCIPIWKFLKVRYDGSVYVCCTHDLGTSLVTNNAYRDSIQDVWMSPALKEARRLHLRRRKLDIATCRRCMVLAHAATIRQKETDERARQAAEESARQATCQHAEFADRGRMA
ncbi:hypothetical protein AMJ82_10645 [candidate division TA06 bacterium SM23_40]|nr:MAG: hypothetical protein AMJ82_10645 [candidate division TA06 bacterium SM23_40]